MLITPKNAMVYTPASASKFPFVRSRMDAQSTKNNTTIYGCESLLFLRVKKFGRHASEDILYIKPETPTNEVNTAPDKTKKASKTMKYWKKCPPMTSASSPNKNSLAWAM